MGFFENSIFFGVILSFVSYGLGTMLQKKFKLPIFNPILVATAIILVVLAVLHLDYNAYNAGAKYISFLLTPATICLAVPMYEKLELLKKNWKAVLVGIVSGGITSLCCILVLCAVFRLSHEEFASLLPKSVTTAIAMGISEELGGIVSITVPIVVVTGILGNIIAPFVCRVFRITEPVARGVGIGTSSHAVGTARAMQMGEIEGAMSSLSIAVAGLITVVLAPLFAQLL